MEAVNLPLVASSQPGLVYLLLPDFDSDAFQGIQFEIFEEEGVLTVYCYESGFEEDGECEGIVYPVALTGENRDAVENLETLQILDPNTLEADRFDDEDYERILDRIDSFFESEQD